MKNIVMILGALLLSTSAFAEDPVTAIQNFQCSPRGSEQKFIVWTEQTNIGSIVTVGTLGQSGLEGIEKIKATRKNSENSVVFSTSEKNLSLIISGDFDGEFYAGELSLENDGKRYSQEVSCESHTPIVVSSRTTLGSGMNRLMNPVFAPSYVWTCTAAPYNNYYYRWFYAQNVYVNVANAQALAYCNNFYGAPICISSCR